MVQLVMRVKRGSAPVDYVIVRFDPHHCLSEAATILRWGSDTIVRATLTTLDTSGDSWDAPMGVQR